MTKIKSCRCQAGIVATKIDLLKQTKDHVRAPLISLIPIPNCHKEPVRLDQHLRSSGKVQDNEEFKQFMIYVRTNFIPDN